MDALGLMEFKGLIPAVAAADGAVKSAAVTLLGLEPIGRGLVTVKLTGDIASVKAGIAAGGVAAQNLGPMWSSTVIGRTGPGVVELILGRGKKRTSSSGPGGCRSHGAPAPAECGIQGTATELEGLRVVQLRSLARDLLAGAGGGDFPLTPEEIKFARKAELVEAITRFRTTVPPDPRR